MDVDLCILVDVFYLHRNMKVQNHTGFGPEKQNKTTNLWPQRYTEKLQQHFVLDLMC